MGEENTAQHCAVWMLYRSRDSNWSLNFYHSPARLLIEAIPCADWLCSYCVWPSEIPPDKQITKLPLTHLKKLFLKKYRACLPSIVNLKRQGFVRKGVTFIVTTFARFARPNSELWKNVERVGSKILHCTIWICNWWYQADLELIF